MRHVAAHRDLVGRLVEVVFVAAEVDVGEGAESGVDEEAVAFGLDVVHRPLQDRDVRCVLLAHLVERGSVQTMQEMMRIAASGACATRVTRSASAVSSA